jgi:hypothetical protein
MSLLVEDMDMGPFVLYSDFSIASMVTRDPEIMEMLRKTMKEGLEVQKRTNVKTALVVPGKYDPKLAWEYQTANVIDAMRMCCDVVGPSNFVLVMEPLNALTDHPGLFLTTIPAGLHDMHSSKPSFMQTSERPLSSANYRRKFNSEYKQGLGCYRSFPYR